VLEQSGQQRLVDTAAVEFVPISDVHLKSRMGGPAIRSAHSPPITIDASCPLYLRLHVLVI
jgi:hypothetical protein